jgi:predicted small lipoprotein YifL
MESRSMNWCCRILILSAVALSLIACGVRGGLDPPPDSQQKKDQPFILDKII